MRLKEFISAHSFATLITHGDSIHLSHLNFIMDEDDEEYLYGHLAFSNQQKFDFSGKTEAIVVFSRDDHQLKSDEPFACFVHGRVERIDDPIQKKKFFSELIARYEPPSEADWSIDWQDTRYLQMMDSVIFFAVKINSIKYQLGSELNESLEAGKKDLYSACIQMSARGAQPEQYPVYIPRAFYEGDKERLLEFIKHKNIALALLYNQTDFFARYINLSKTEDMKTLWSSSFAEVPEDTKVLLVLKGPHCYISPRFYHTRFNVPTWNYTMVYVEGRLSSQQFEPTHVFGKFKLSQNRATDDKASVCKHLSESADEMDRETAHCMRQLGMK